MNDQDEYASLLKELDQDGKHLTDWEADFVDKMLKQLEAKQPFSKKQGAKIEDIYNKRVCDR